MPRFPAFLESRVARRFLLLIATLVLIPVALTGSFAYWSIREQAMRTAERQLHEAAKAFALEALGRIQLASSMLRATGPAFPAGRNGKEDTGNLLLGRPLRVIDSVGAAELPEPIRQSIEALQRADAGVAGTRVVFLADGRGGITNYLIQEAAGDSPRREFIVAEIPRGFLWNIQDVLPAGFQYCAIAQGGMVVFCSQEALATQFTGLRDVTGADLPDSFEYTAGDTPFLGAAWSLPDVQGYSGLEMDVLASERKDLLLSPAVTYRNTVPPALGVTLLAAVWIAIVLVRRRMQPLDELVVATDRLARGDFSSPVRVESDDEFAGVGRAFNAMQGMLGRQFAELAALSKVDRLILEVGSLNSVMEAAAREIAALQPDGVAAMVMLDQDSPSRSVVFWTAGTDVQVLRGAIDQRAIAQLDDLHGSGSADGPAAVLIGLGLDQLFPARAQLVAVRDGDEVIGVIAISDPDDPDLRGHQQRLARQFADRLSVAAATIRQRARLYALGHIDDLTGLPNRQLFKERLGQALNHSLASGVPGHLLYIDLDRFKQVNDAEGHAMGDRLLCAAAERIVSCVRLTDTVARLAGDEFTVLLADPVDPAEVTAIAERIVAVLQRPFRLETMEYFISASIGVASFPGDGDTLVQVIRNADLAMYAAKEAGGGRIVRYEPAMQASVHDRVEAEAALRHAVDHGEFCMFYQPQIEADSGRVSGVEALIRWQRPGIGLVSPGSFIPLAESTGLIRELGEFALETACRDFVAWRAAGLELDTVSVNVSLRELKDPEFETHLAGVLDRTGLPRGCLELEVTESVMAEDIVRASARLWSIQARGVSIAIDDFGTGYSSLAYLRGFPVDTLKIDRTFVQDIPASASAASLLESIVEMARRLGKNTVAEGVETIEQARFLEKCRCSHLQGYLFARPMPEADFFNYALAKNSLPRRERRLAG